MNHGGGTAGYLTFIALDPERRIGVVVLSNQAPVNPIGMHLLDPRYPLSTGGLELAFVIMAITLALLLVIGAFIAYKRTGSTTRQALKPALWLTFGVLVWLFMTSTAARIGLLRFDRIPRFDKVPPTMMITLVITIVLSVWLARSRVGGRLAAGLPLAVLVGVQAFRLPLELMLHRAYEYGLLPVQMTYTGLNFDIVTGILAIVVAVLVAMGRAGYRTVRVWNLLGSVLLVIVVTIALLSAPTPLRMFHDPPSTVVIVTAPYIWLPTVMVAFAIVGHIVIFRRLRLEKTGDIGTAGGAG